MAAAGPKLLPQDFLPSPSKMKHRKELQASGPAALPVALNEPEKDRASGDVLAQCQDSCRASNEDSPGSETRPGQCTHEYELNSGALTKSWYERRP